MPVAARSKACVCGCCITGITGSNPAGGMAVCLSLSRVFCVFRSSGRSLEHRSPTECGASECDREASIMKRMWPTGGCCTMRGKKKTWDGGYINLHVRYFKVILPYILESNPRPNLIRTSFCRFLKRKKKS